MALTKAHNRMIDGSAVNVKDFGAIGDGTTDDTTALQAAFDAAATAGVGVYAEGTFKITGIVYIKGNADLSKATFNVHDTPAVAVEVSTGPTAISTGGTATLLRTKVIWLPEVNNMTKPATGWAGQGTGVRVVNLYESQLYVNKITGFDIGLLLTSKNTGTAYNNITLGFLDNNKVNLSLAPVDGTGWVNENNIIGGRFYHDGSEGTNVSGVRHILIAQNAAPSGSGNNNLFVKPSVEGDVPEYTIECAGAYNTFLQGRYEGAPKVLYTGTSANYGTDNVIFGGYAGSNITYTYSGTTGQKNQSIGFRGGNFATVSSTEGAFKYMNTSGSGEPVFAFFEANTQPEGAASGEWSGRVSAQGIKGKQKADTYERINVDFVNGRMLLGAGSAAPTSFIRAFGANRVQVQAVGSGRAFEPTDDDVIALGGASNLWSEVFSGTGTINTSDERKKQDIRNLSDAEAAVAVRLKGLVKAYRFKNAVEKKGDEARIHVGVIAQEVIAAFEAEGLDPMRYGIVCYDEWEADEDKEAGNAYGVRYDELWAFIISAL